MSGRWNVWSKDERTGTWLVVAEGLGREDAQQRAERMNLSAVKFETNGTYLALKQGETP